MGRPAQALPGRATRLSADGSWPPSGLVSRPRGRGSAAAAGPGDELDELVRADRQVEQAELHPTGASVPIGVQAGPHSRRPSAAGRRSAPRSRPRRRRVRRPRVRRSSCPRRCRVGSALARRAPRRGRSRPSAPPGSRRNPESAGESTGPPARVVVRGGPRRGGGDDGVRAVVAVAEPADAQVGGDLAGAGASHHGEGSLNAR